MTLQDFFTWATNNYQLVALYFILIPVIAIILWWVAKGHGHESPWNYAYAILVYLVCIPGIFAFTLSLYIFIFQRGDVFQTNLLLQVLPVMSMVLTLWLIRRNVSFEQIPWFGNISRLITILFVAFILMFLADKIHIYSITFVPLWQIILIFIGLVLLIRYAWTKLF